MASSLVLVNFIIQSNTVCSLLVRDLQPCSKESLLQASECGITAGDGTNSENIARLARTTHTLLLTHLSKFVGSLTPTLRVGGARAGWKNVAKADFVNAQTSGLFHWGISALVKPLTSRLRPLRIQSTSTPLSRLEGMHVSGLKELLRKMGGNPGVMKKAQLVSECHQLLLVRHAEFRDSGPTPVASAVAVAATPASSALQPASRLLSPAAPKSSINSSRSDKNNNSSNTRGHQQQRQQTARSSTLRKMQPLNENNGQSPSSTQQGVAAGKAYKHPWGPQRDARFRDEALTADMDVTFLGTASCVPSISRGVSCIALRAESDVWLFDCGESTQLQIQKSRIKPSRIKKIFITHAHGDHAFGLPGVLCLIGQSTQEEREQARLEGGGGGEVAVDREGHVPDDSSVVDIYGPEGIRDLVRASVQLTYSRVVAPFRVHELKDVPYLHGKQQKWRPPVPNVRTRFDAYYGEQEGSRDIYPDEIGTYEVMMGLPHKEATGGGRDDGPRVSQLLSVRAAPMQHTVPCVGYVVQEPIRQGRLKFEKVKPLVEMHKDALKSQLGLRDPNKLYAVLKNMQPGDEPFVFPDGTALSPEDVLEQPRPGRKLVVMGDTCSGAAMAELAANADMLVHEATNAFIKEHDQGRYSGYDALERDTIRHGHSTPQMAGRFSALVNAQRLILTHFSPRYRGDDDLPNMQTMWSIEEMARATCGLKDGGDVVAAWDQLVLPLPLRRSNSDSSE